MKPEIDEGTFAFPWKSEELGFMCRGMELRDYFAAAAMPAIIRQCAGDTIRMGIETAEQMFARKAYQVADAMMEARK